jgi:hypothetical protein
MRRVALILIFFALRIASDVTFLKVKSFRCTSSNKSITPDYKCFAKSYSRQFSGANFAFKFIRPVYNMKVRVHSELLVLLPDQKLSHF